jgi:hypothetical protein
MSNHGVLLDEAADLISVHARHKDVEQNDIGQLAINRLRRLIPSAAVTTS